MCKLLQYTLSEWYYLLMAFCLQFERYFHGKECCPATLHSDRTSDSGIQLPSCLSCVNPISNMWWFHKSCPLLFNCSEHSTSESQTLNCSVCFNLPCPAVLRKCFWWNKLINSQSRGPYHSESCANMHHTNMINKRTPWSKRGQSLHHGIKNETMACQQL